MRILLAPRRARRRASPLFEQLDERITPTATQGVMATIASAALDVANNTLNSTVAKDVELAGDRHFAARVEKLEHSIGRTERRLDRALARHRMHAAAHLDASLSVQVQKLTAMVDPFGTDPPASGSLPSNVPPQLATIYQQYEQWVAGGEQGTFVSSESAIVEIQGTNVGIEVHDGNPADFAALGTELQNLGMQVNSSSATYGIYSGFIPIAQIAAVAQLPQTPNLSPLMYPILNAQT
jgi:hypothetical protein